MPVKYFNQKRINGGFVRPRGYSFPTGLSAFYTGNNVIDYLVVGGGGGTTVQNQYSGGGGGGGGFLTGSNLTVPFNTSFTITVGNGAPYSQTSGTGGNSSIVVVAPASFTSIIAIGGGIGQFGDTTGAGVTTLPTVGGSGGGGSGQGQPTTAGGPTGANGTPGQGNKGGNGAPGPSGGYGAGGGGGAGAVGANGGSDGRGGNGGAGLASPLSGTPVTYAGGGGGGGWGGAADSTGGSGGAGGGGAGSDGAPAPATGTDGTANRGGGGGGTGRGLSANPTHGGSGGSGIVIIRYAGAQAAGGGVYSNPAPGAYSIHTFTGSGTFTTNSNFRATSTGYLVN